VKFWVKKTIKHRFLKLPALSDYCLSLEAEPGGGSSVSVSSSGFILSNSDPVAQNFTTVW
jgi:hypothetical protein